MPGSRLQLPVACQSETYCTRKIGSKATVGAEVVVASTCKHLSEESYGAAARALLHTEVSQVSALET